MTASITVNGRHYAIRLEAFEGRWVETDPDHAQRFIIVAPDGLEHPADTFRAALDWAEEDASGCAVCGQPRHHPFHAPRGIFGRELETHDFRRPALACAGCGESWPCSDSARADISGRERAKHHR
jgi:hypothetical protein